MPSLEVRCPLQVVRTYTKKWNVELPPNGKGGAFGVNVRRERERPVNALPRGIDTEKTRAKLLWR